MKKLFLKIFVIIFAIFLIHKIYHYVIMNKLYNGIENFKKEENSSYSTILLKDGKEKCSEKVFVKNNIVKYIKNKGEYSSYCEIKDFNKNTSIAFNIKNNQMSMYDGELFIAKDNFMTNFPNLILYAYSNGKINLKGILDIYYIVPTKYNDKKCYKIVTSSEIVIIDRETYLPVYSCLNAINSDNQEECKNENIYEFTVGNVTDEDIAIPDLTDYFQVFRIMFFLQFPDI